MIFLIFISFLILQRLAELFIASRNEKWLSANGAVESGQEHYPFIVALHVLFFLSLIIEYEARFDTTTNWFLLGLFLVLIGFKVWAISSLGKFWNTKIFRIKGMIPVKKGPYKFIRHPNYIIVIGEFLVIPLIFHLYTTAIIFSILNGIVLTVRIKKENKAWLS